MAVGKGMSANEAQNPKSLLFTLGHIASRMALTIVYLQFLVVLLGADANTVM